MRFAVKCSFFLLVLSLGALAQVAPNVSQFSLVDTGQCNSSNTGTSEIPCTGAETYSWIGWAPYSGECSEGPILTSGPNSGYARLICINIQDVIEAKVQWTKKDATGATMVCGPTDTGCSPGVPVMLPGFPMEYTYWLSSHLPATGCTGCQETVPTQPNQPLNALLESQVFYAPTVGSSGAFLMFFHDCESKTASGGSQSCAFPSTNQFPMIAISTSNDPGDNTGCPTSCGWIIRQLTTPTNTPSGDFTPRGFCTKLACYMITYDITNATQYNDVIWAWGPASLAGLNSSSIAQVPAPDATYNRASTFVPSLFTFPVVHAPNDTGDGTADHLISMLDGNGNGQNGTYGSVVTITTFTWSGHTPTVSKASSSIVTSATYCSNGPSNQCTFNVNGAVQWRDITNTAAAAATVLTMPGNYTVISGSNYLANTNTSRNENARFSGYATELNGHIYSAQSMGGTSINTSAAGQRPTGFWMYDITVPASPSVNVIGSCGGGAQDTIDCENVNTTADAFGNIYWGAISSDRYQFLSHTTLYITPANSYASVRGPDLDYPVTTGTITTNTTTQYNFTSGSPTQVGLILKNVSGNFLVQDCSSNPLSVRKSGTSVTVAAGTAITADGAFTINSTGLSCVQLVNTGVAGTVTYYFQEVNGSSRDESSCQNSRGAGNNNVSPVRLVPIMSTSHLPTPNTYLAGLDGSFGGTNNRCSWTVGTLWTSAHGKPNSITVSGGATTCATSTNTAAFVSTMVWPDTSSGRGSNEGGVWSIDNTVGGTFIDSGGVLHCGTVGSQTVHVTRSLMGMTSAQSTVSITGGVSLTAIQWLTPTSPASISLEQTITATVQCSYTSGGPDNCGGAGTYTSDNTACATVAPGSPGNATITSAANFNTVPCTAHINLQIGSINSSPTLTVNVNRFGGLFIGD